MSTTRRLAGRLVHQQTLRLPAAADTQVVVRISAVGCAEPPVRSVRVELRGHYTTGFESSDFRPCGGLPAEAAVYGPDWGAAWVEFADSVRGRELKWPTLPDTVFDPTLYVRWRGTMTGPGAYGHMGVAIYNLVVDEILDVHPPRADDCK